MYLRKKLHLIATVALSFILGSFAPVQAEPMPFSEAVVWNGHILLCDGIVRYGVVVKGTGPQIATAVTQSGMEIMAVTTDASTGEAVSIVRQSPSPNDFSLRVQKNASASTIPIPSNIAPMLNERHWLFASGGKIYLFNRRKYAEFRGGKWALNTLTPPARWPQWSQHVQQILFAKDLIVEVCRAGEWGNGITAFDLARKKWRMIYDDHSDQVLSAVSAGDGVWILTKTRLLFWEGKSMSLRTENTVHDKANERYQWPSCLYADMSGKLYSADAKGDIFSYPKGSLVLIAQVNQSLLYQRGARSNAGNIVVPPLEARWLCVGNGLAIIQYSDLKLIVNNPKTKQSFVPAIGQDYLKL